MFNRKVTRQLIFFGGLATVVLYALVAFAQGSPDPFGGDTAYREAVDPDGPFSWLSPRVIIWVLAQLHLLFAAFVLAVPMFVLLIEVVGIRTKDPVESKKYDDLAHEFAKLMTTAFSITSILGAIFTFACMGMYPKLFNYLAEVFGPSMYLYSCIFFGESFSLYFYYYGWGKMKSRWAHVGVGVLLNFFGISLMLIANAWTTFMMAPAGLDDAGMVVDRNAAFFNFLLHPINIHRLIANICLGGSVAGAYAAFKFLTSRTEAERAHYDWMGYIGNFIAVLALLPLPFAGYYLGFEIYAYNQQLGIYMMGGVLSWLFVMQAFLIGGLFFGANYYLWLGMDRIEGSERYRGWIKFLLIVVTICILVWATPKSLILSSAEIDVMGGTNHPILSLFGVMSAKNTAVNILILTTFLSFLIYRRGNKQPTVSWAKTGTRIQALCFGIATAVVVVIGVGGYLPSMWLESTKRVAMSPYQVLAVLACMAVVMPIDIALLKGAKEIGAIRWGKVSRRSQYVLLFLAVSFTWLMALMGFVRSALRQHWHVYEVMKDTSPEAYTPSLGYATIVCTVVVVIFFALIGLVVTIANLGSKPKVTDAERAAAEAEGGSSTGKIIGAVVVVAILYGLFGGGSNELPEYPSHEETAQRKADEAGKLVGYNVVDAERGVYKIPVDTAMDLVVNDPARLAPPVTINADLDEMSPLERGEYIFAKSSYACGACHSVDGTVGQAPTMQARFGKPSELSDGSSVTFDEAYFRESLTDPTAKFSKGFSKEENAAAAVMPSFAGQISEQEISDLLAYLKSL